MGRASPEGRPGLQAEPKPDGEILQAVTKNLGRSTAASGRLPAFAVGYGGEIGHV